MHYNQLWHDRETNQLMIEIVLPEYGRDNYFLCRSQFATIDTKKQLYISFIRSCMMVKYTEQFDIIDYKTIFAQI